MGFNRIFPVFFRGDGESLWDLSDLTKMMMQCMDLHGI